MHVDQPLRAGPLVQIVDILRDEQELARPFLIQPRQRPMRRVRLDGPELGPPLVVEGVDQRRIARESLGRADILDAMPLPQPVGPAKGREPAFRGNTGAGEDDDQLNCSHRRELSDAASVWNG